MSLRSVARRIVPASAWTALRRLRRWWINRKPARDVFQTIYERNTWGHAESVSGPGSSMEETETVRRLLPDLLVRTGARSLLDVPCGDFHWMKEVDLGAVDYTGAEVVPALVEANEAQFAAPNRRFVELDLIHDALPQADVVLCRDCLIHLPNEMALRALANIRASGAERLVTTTFVDMDENIEIELGGWRPVNLRLPPFNLPEPQELHYEGPNQGKSLGVWLVKDLAPLG